MEAGWKQVGSRIKHNPASAIPFIYNELDIKEAGKQDHFMFVIVDYGDRF